MFAGFKHRSSQDIWMSIGKYFRMIRAACFNRQLTTVLDVGRLLGISRPYSVKLISPLQEVGSSRIRNMGVSKNRGGPPKWMVKIMGNPIKMDDLGGKTHYSRKHP